MADNNQKSDFIIIGTGIMGVTLATMLKEIDETLNITILEKLSGPAQGNTQAFNNAGTGHEANCEFNYTPVDDDCVDISKALKIHAQFNVAKQFWSYLVEKGIITDPKSFLRQVKHVTVVKNHEHIEQLRMRYDQISKHHFFDEIIYSEDHQQLKEWIPIIMENHKPSDLVAATMIKKGTDINFEALTKQMLQYLVTNKGVKVVYNCLVVGVKQVANTWHIKAKQNSDTKVYCTDKVFVGAGGGAFSLLKKSSLTARKQYAGFPIGGYFLSAQVSDEIAKYYSVKAYGKAAVGSPPMSVPHLDIRHINNKYYLLFGPFATFSCKLEKDRSFLNYLLSLRIHDVLPLLKVAMKNMNLLRYLIRESLKNKQALLDELEEFAPGSTKKFSWKLLRAGQRVQIMKNAKLEMGTEMVFSHDKSFSALLGASPGASTSPYIMLEWLRQGAPDLLKKAQHKINKIFPAAQIEQLINDKELYKENTQRINKILKIASS